MGQVGCVGGGASLQIRRLESFSLDQSLQTGGPPTGWIGPADVFCLAHTGFLKNRLTCQHSLMGIYYTKIWGSGFFGKTGLSSHTQSAFLLEQQQAGEEPPSPVSTACVVWFTTAGTAPSCPLGARHAWLMGIPRPGTSDYGEKNGGSAVPGLLICPQRTRWPPTHSYADPQSKEDSIQCVHESVQVPAYDRTVFGAERTEGWVVLKRIFTSLALFNLRLGLACRGKPSHLQTIRPLTACYTFTDHRCLGPGHIARPDGPTPVFLGRYFSTRGSGSHTSWRIPELHPHELNLDF